jgi:isopentenyl diphosphate isomerase/L-lactate dehydrogenase-like FMN-dependent dehydrogenase
LSSPELLRRVLPALLAAAVVLGASGCAAEAAGAQAAGASSIGSVPADATTQRIAEVEHARQCAVASLAFPDEAAITTDLDDRLAAAGLTHQQWKDWHDALAVSPDLVAQLTEVGPPAC